MAGRGMLGEFFQPRLRDVEQQEQNDERRLLDLASDPFKAMAYTSLKGGQMAGRGLGGAVVAAAGGDPRSPTERNQQAVEAAKAQVAQLGIDPEDPASIDQFYKQVIQILQKQGLAAEALAVGKEWNAEKNKRVEQGFKERELQRREKRDVDQHNLGVLRLATQAEIASAKNATAREIADAKLTAEQMRDGPFKSVDYGDRVDLINRHGEIVSSKPKAMNPKDADKDSDKKQAAERAYGEYMAGLQRQYDAAVQLHNHRGVEGITGRFGRLVGEEGAVGQSATTLASADARAALALHKQVTGGAFLAGLAKLKQASASGATGLGAVSEREGDKVQSDAAAISREQDAADYRAQLAVYIQQMDGFAGRMAEAARADKIAPRPLSTKPLAVPQAAAPKAAPRNPAPAPAAPKTEEWERGPDGKPRRKK